MNYPSFPFPTKSKVVTGQHAASYIAETLVNESAWFAFMPLPDDQYQFDVKPERYDTVVALAQVAYQSFHAAK